MIGSEMQVPFLDLQHGHFILFFLHIKKSCINVKAFIMLAQISVASPAAPTPSPHADARGSTDAGLLCAQTSPPGPAEPPMASASQFCLLCLEGLLGYGRELLITELQTFFKKFLLEYSCFTILY